MWELVASLSLHGAKTHNVQQDKFFHGIQDWEGGLLNSHAQLFKWRTAGKKEMVQENHFSSRDFKEVGIDCLVEGCYCLIALMDTLDEGDM